jgi:hypothetical protein
LTAPQVQKPDKITCVDYSRGLRPQRYITEWCLKFQATHTLEYRIIWHISPPYVARARQMPSLRGGLIAKGFTMVDSLCAIQILQRPSLRGGLICQIIRYCPVIPVAFVRVLSIISSGFMPILKLQVGLRTGKRRMVLGSRISRANHFLTIG